jgi:hypothetical protein
MHKQYIVKYIGLNISSANAVLTLWSIPPPYQAGQVIYFNTCWAQVNATYSNLEVSVSKNIETSRIYMARPSGTV